MRKIFHITKKKLKCFKNLFHIVNEARNRFLFSPVCFLSLHNFAQIPTVHNVHLIDAINKAIERKKVNIMQIIQLFFFFLFAIFYPLTFQQRWQWWNIGSTGVRLMPSTTWRLLKLSIVLCTPEIRLFGRQHRRWWWWPHKSKPKIRPSIQIKSQNAHRSKMNCKISGNLTFECVTLWMSNFFVSLPHIDRIYNWMAKQFSRESHTRTHTQTHGHKHPQFISSIHRTKA